MEPHILYYWLLGKPMNSANPKRRVVKDRYQLLQKLGEYIRLNLFIPDSRIGWFRNACQMAERAIQQENPAVVFTSAPPFTTHLIGLRIRKRFGLPWIADFRDPWLENLHYNTVPRFPIVKKINRLMERKVLQSADRLTCVGQHLKDLLASKITFPPESKCYVITNGYDRNDRQTNCGDSNRFHLSYFGTIYPRRFPITLLGAVKELLDNNLEFSKDFKFRVVGHISPEVQRQILKTMPENNVSLESYVSHQALLPILYESQILLLTVDEVPMREHIITGKLFDYLPTGNPILGVGPVAGDASRIIQETNTGVMFHDEDAAGIKQFVFNKYHEWKNKTLNTGVREFPDFERENLTKRLADLFNDLLGMF